MIDTTYTTGEVLTNVREYAEENPVKLVNHEGRLVIFAINEGGHNGVAIDLSDLLAELERRGLIGAV